MFIFEKGHSNYSHTICPLSQTVSKNLRQTEFIYFVTELFHTDMI